MEQRRDLKVGVVGCGHIAPKHFQAIREVEGLKLAAICDVDSMRLAKWKNRLKVPAYHDYETLLDRANLDIVSICTPNYLHASMAQQALEAKMHVLVEKPLALTYNDAILLGRLSQKTEKALFNVLQVRFNSVVRLVKALLDNSGLGRLYIVSLNQYWNRRQDYYSGSENWHGRRDLEGGALFTQGIHYIDLLLYFAGSVSEVSAIVETQAHDIETEDTVIAELKYKNGAVGCIEFTLNSYMENIEASISLLGERGTVKISGPAANELVYWNVHNYPKPQVYIQDKPNRYNGKYVGSPANHIFIYRNIVAHLFKKEPIAVPYSSAARSIRLIEAIYESAQKRKTVKIET